MIPKDLARLEIELRVACEQERYGAVERLALAFGDAARREIGKLEPGDPGAAKIGRHALDALERSRLVVLAGRARSAGKLRCIRFLNRYQAKSVPRPPMVRMDA
jgi:hypothetical protein